MIAMRPSKNVRAPMNAIMIAAKPTQPVHVVDMDMSWRLSIVLMHCSFLGRRGRVGPGAAQGSNAQDLLLLGRELLVREDPLVVQLRQVLKLIAHVWLSRCGLGRRSLLRLVVAVVVALIVVHRVLTAVYTPRRTPRGTASDPATWSEHQFLPFVFWPIVPR